MSYIHSQISTQVHAYTVPFTHSHTPIQNVQACTYAHSHAHKYTHIYANIHTYMTHTQAHTHAHLIHHSEPFSLGIRDRQYLCVFVCVCVCVFACVCIRMHALAEESTSFPCRQVRTRCRSLSGMFILLTTRARSCLSSGKRRVVETTCACARPCMFVCIRQMRM